MGVDFDVDVIYGFQLDTEMIKKVLELQGEDFSFYELQEAITEQTNCSLIEDNYYVDWECTNVYFGIPVYNFLTAATCADIEKNRRQEVIDSLMEYFGGFEALEDGTPHEPVFYSVGVVW
jgi:hypothetical protein